MDFTRFEGGVYSFLVRNDANTAGSNVFTITRTGATIDAVNFSSSLQKAGSEVITHAEYRTKMKQVSETVVNSNVLQDDDELFFSVEAVKQYVFRLYVRTSSSSATPDFKLTMNGPAGCWISFNYNSANIEYNIGDEVAIAVLAGQVRMSIIQGIITVGATAGSLTLQWAQQVADPTGTTVLVGSWMTIEELP